MSFDISDLKSALCKTKYSVVSICFFHSVMTMCYSCLLIKSHTLESYLFYYFIYFSNLLNCNSLLSRNPTFYPKVNHVFLYSIPSGANNLAPSAGNVLYQSKVWTHFPIYLNGNMCPNIWLEQYICIFFHSSFFIFPYSSSTGTQKATLNSQCYLLDNC